MTPAETDMDKMAAILTCGFTIAWALFSLLAFIRSTTRGLQQEVAELRRDQAKRGAPPAPTKPTPTHNLCPRCKAEDEYEAQIDEDIGARRRREERAMNEAMFSDDAE